MLLAALLLGLAVAALVARPRPAARLGALLPSAAVTPAPGPQDPARLGVVLCRVLAVLLLPLLGLKAGVPFGLAVALVGPRVVSRLLDQSARRDEELATHIPLALDLLSACMLGGAPVAHALDVVASATKGVTGERLHLVAAALRLGAPPSEAFLALGDEGAAGAAARSLSRACEGGTPVAAAVATVATDARRRARVVARKRVRRAGTLATLPLTLCFLPAFLVLGIVPGFVGIAGPLLGAL